MDIKDAIKISQIISQAPEERIPMILSVLEKAEVSINGLDELEEWKAFKDQSVLIDLQQFIKELLKAYPAAEEGLSKIPIAEFNEFCKARKLRATPVKKLLSKTGWLRTNEENTGKINYTETAYVDGKIIRCVAIFGTAQTEVKK